MDSLAYTSHDSKERTDKALAALITLIIHGGLLLFLLWYVIVTPIPPYPLPVNTPELEVALAGGGGGSGAMIAQTVSSKPSAENNVTKAATTVQSNMPTINNNAEPSTPMPSEKATVVHKKIDTVPKPQEPSVELVNLENKFIKSSKSSSGGGNASHGEQGGGGNTGNGSGQGGGSGSGIGTGVGSGKGFGYDLSGRELVKRPTLVTNNPEQGQIVVGITVDQDGNVTDAVPGVKGSTITDASLYILVKNAAMKVKFNRSPNTPEQTGTVTFRFTIQ